MLAPPTLKVISQPGLFPATMGMRREGIAKQSMPVMPCAAIIAAAGVRARRSRAPLHASKDEDLGFFGAVGLISKLFNAATQKQMNLEGKDGIKDSSIDNTEVPEISEERAGPFYHYTDEEGAKAIDESGKLKPTRHVDAVRDAAGGEGIYATDMKPDEFTKTDILLKNYGQETKENSDKMRQS